jgi:predicted Zn-dependent peptidase
MTPDDMRGFWAAHLRPENAVIFVGGSLTADEIIPRLEARLAGWRPAESPARTDPSWTRRDQPGTLFLVDKPGAAQSVVRVIGPSAARTDPDWFAWFIANEAFGGSFTGRMNAVLREEKGYTYGIRCGFEHSYAPTHWRCTASVATDVTAPALAAMIGEIGAAIGERPLTDDEITRQRDSNLLGYPGRYELTDAVLGEQEVIWRYALPSDWPDRFLPGVRAVTTDAANAALRAHLRPDALTWVVVGDKQKIAPELAESFTIVELDRDGRPLPPTR